MPKSGNLRVLFVTTWAFTACFAVWTMFGVTGIPIRAQLNLDSTQFGLLTATPVLTGALFRLPLGMWTDRFGGRVIMLLLLVGCAVPLWISSYATRALAVFAARPGTRAGRRFLLGRHALCRALLSKGEPWVRHGILRRRHHGRGAQHVRRPVSGRYLWLAIGAEGLRGRSSRHRGHVLVLLRP